MKTALIVSLVLFASSAQASNFVRLHEALFSQQSLCDGGPLGQETSAEIFKAMLQTYKSDDLANRRSRVEVVAFSASRSELRDRSTGQSCSINLYSGCYTSSCE